MKRPLSLQILLFIIIRIVLNTMIRMVYPYLGSFSSGLGVDITALSRALTLRSAAGIFGPFLAFLADSRGRKVGMLLGLSLFTLGSGLMVILPSFQVFILTLILTLVGNLVFIPSMQAYLGDRIAYRSRGLVLAMTELGWSLSFIIGIPLMGLLILRGGWQAPFPFLAVFGLVAMVALVMVIPADRPSRDVRVEPWRNFKTVFSHTPALAGVLMGAAISAANEQVNLVFGVWIEETFGVQIAALAAASIVIGLSELLGESLVGGFVDRLGKVRAVAVGILLNCLAALALPVLGGSLSGAFAGLFFFYITFEFTIVSSIPLMTEVLPAARATLMATFVAGFAGGRAIGALSAAPLYTSTPLPGIIAVSLGSLLFNLVGLLALRHLRTSTNLILAEKAHAEVPD